MSTSTTASAEPGKNLRFDNTNKIHEATMQMSEEDDDVDETMEAPPSTFRMNRRTSVAAESFNPHEADSENSEDESAAAGATPKSEEQRKRLEKATKDILVFRCLDKKQLDRVIRAMNEVTVHHGERVITQGEEGNHFYVIEKGSFDIHLLGGVPPKTPLAANTDNIGPRISCLDGSGSFGELALMYNTPRAATIICSSPDGGIIWSLDRSTFRRIVLKRAFRKRRMYEQLLRQVPLLVDLSEFERANLCDALKSREFAPGEKIFEQGDDGEEMFFVEDGEISILRRSTILQENETKEVSRLKKGGYFGELAIITNKPRLASAVSVGHSKVAVLDKNAFERLMGPVVSIMMRNTETYVARLSAVFGSENEIPELLQLCKIGDDN